MLKSTLDNVEWMDEGKTKFKDFKDRGDKLIVMPNSGDPFSSSCHGNTLNLRPGTDMYIAGLDGQGCDNVSKIFKNKAEFTPVKAEDVKPGDVAIFEDDKGNIQHSATVTKVKKNGNVKLTSKDDRNPVQRNQSIDDIKKTNPAYKNLQDIIEKMPIKKLIPKLIAKVHQAWQDTMTDQRLRQFLRKQKRMIKKIFSSTMHNFFKLN